jgi:DNA-binding NarL/FixJ family response regulator
MQTRPIARWVIPREVPLAGQDALSVRESEILTLIAGGLTSAAIGRRLSISSRTVEKHVENLHRKIGVNSSIAAIQYILTCRNGRTSERSMTT